MTNKTTIMTKEELIQKMEKLRHQIQFGKKSEVDKPKLKEELLELRKQLDKLK
jgi:hypothetical protein